jgi:hypothetical protein
MAVEPSGTGRDEMWQRREERNCDKPLLPLDRHETETAPAEGERKVHLEKFAVYPPLGLPFPRCLPSSPAPPAGSATPRSAAAPAARGAGGWHKC